MKPHLLAAAALALAANSGAFAQPAPFSLTCEFRGDKGSEFDRCWASVAISVPTAVFRVVCDGNEIYQGPLDAFTAITDPGSPDSTITAILALSDGEVRFPILKFDDRLFSNFENEPARLYVEDGAPPMFGTCDGRVIEQP